MNKSLLILLFLFSSPALFSQTTRVLIVGDSWAQQQFDDGIHNQIFIDNGYADFVVAGSTTAINGTQASDWASPDQLQVIANAIISNPDIDTVQLTIGGNDFLNAWQADMTVVEEMALQQQILTDINTIVDFILLQNNNIEVILSFYDYPNFVDTISGVFGIFCLNLLNNMSLPTTLELNTAAQVFEQIYAQAAQSNPRVFYVSHLGMMQAFYGFPDDGIAPGDILPPGDLTLPSPAAAMRLTLGVTDCFHLSPDSYDLLVQNLFDGYFHTRFDTVFKAGFE